MAADKVLAKPICLCNNPPNASRCRPPEMRLDRKDQEMGFLDWVEVRWADAAAGRHP